MNKLSIGIFMTIIAGFCLIIWVTDAVSLTFGNTGEIVALSLVAIILMIGLVKAWREKNDDN